MDRATKSFVIGSIVTVSKPTFMEPELTDSDPPYQNGNYGAIPTGGRIKILEKKESDDDINFHVAMLTSQGNLNKDGWIRGSLLIQATVGDPQDFYSKVEDIQTELKEKYEELIAKKYNFTRYHTGQIQMEGFRKRWPYPKAR